MTNAQKWVAVFLILFVLLLVLSKITSNKSKENLYETPQNEYSSDSSRLNAEDILSSNRCLTCHGKDLNGSGRAPSLLNVAENWKKDNLISYLQNPQAFLNNERMLVLKEKYNTQMPAQDNLSTEELNIVAEYLINKSKKND
jgi:mono/diheme cytochrome c family protein